MEYFEWTDELSVNIEEIDNQHKEFIHLTNVLIHAIKNKNGEEIIGETLSNLIEYANMHFATEERLMKAHGYPDLTDHEKEHAVLKKHILEINRRVNAEQLLEVATVVYFLEDWITSHFKMIDMKYSPFLNSKGVY